MIPLVDYRFGEVYKVTDFIQVENPTCQEFVEPYLIFFMKQKSNDRFIEELSNVINVGFEYPLNILSQPSPEASLSRYQPIPLLPIWFNWSKRVDYNWQFPCETIVTKRGICIDTANLYITLLLANTGINAFVCIGRVYQTKDNVFLGGHAWGLQKYRGNWWITETTIHTGINNMILADDIYNKKLDVYYVLDGKYHTTDFFPEPERQLLIRFLARPDRKIMSKQLKEERKKQQTIWQAFQNFDDVLEQKGKKYSRQIEMKAMRLE